MAVTLPKTLVANTPENINDVQSNFSALITALNALGGDVTGTLDATLIAKITGTKTRFGTGGNIVSSANNSAAVYSNYNAATDRSYDSTAASWAVVMGDGSSDRVAFYRAGATAGVPSFTLIASFDLPIAGSSRLSLASNAPILSIRAATLNSFSTGSALFYVNYIASTDRSLDSTKPSWRLYMNVDGGADMVTLDRAPATAGSPVWATWFSLSNAGAIGTATIPFAQVTGTVTPSNDTVTSAKIVDGTITSGDIADGTLAPGDFTTLPHVRAFHNTTQSIPNATPTALVFNSERWDSGTGTEQHSTSSNTSRLTCRQAGLYQIEAHCEWQSGGANSQRNLTIKLNGTTNIAIDQRIAVNGGPPVFYNIASTQYRLTAGDYIEAVVYQDNGTGAQVVNSTNNSSPEFMMCWVGP